MFFLSFYFVILPLSYSSNIFYVGWDSVGCIATSYGLDGPEIESRKGRIFCTGPGAHSASYTMSTGLFPGIKRPRRGVNHPHSSSAEVRERIGLYFYFFSVPSCQVIGWNLALLYHIFCTVCLRSFTFLIVMLLRNVSGRNKILWNENRNEAHMKAGIYVC